MMTAVTRRQRRAHHHQRGFALLFVFAMAAAIVVLLYLETPRVLFQGQRQKEQLLVERGEQYRRAIQLYVRHVKKFPSRIEDLESTNGTRYLRRKFKDPMTGKDDWRLVHIDALGALTDSKVQKPTNPLAKPGDNQYAAAGQPVAGTPGAFPGQPGAFPGQPGPFPIAGYSGLAGPGGIPGQGFPGQPIPGQPGEQTPGWRRGASDRPAAVAGQELPGFPQDPNQPYDPNRPPDPNQPGQPTDPNQPVPPDTINAPFPPGQPVAPQPYPVQPGVQPGVQPIGPQYPGQVVYPGQPGVPGQPVYPGQPRYPGQAPYPGQGAYPGQAPYPVQPAYPGQPPIPALAPYYPLAGQTQPQPGFPGQPSRPGGLSSFPQPGGAPSNSQAGGAVPFPIPGGIGQPGTPNAAADLIRQILTQPRPGGLLGAAAATGSGFGAGIAGVATKYEGEGIRVYNERTKYEEWEFLYDPKQDRSGAIASRGAGNMTGMPGAGSPSGPSTGPARGPGGFGPPSGAPQAPSSPRLQ